LIHNLKLLAILNTHGHFDHVGEVQNLKNKFGCPFYLHSKDEKLLKTANFYLKLFEGEDKILIPKIDYYLDYLKILHVGNFFIEIFPTPGHTEGSVSFFINNFLFSGDVLFKNDIGRLDLPGGNATKMKESLMMVAALSEEVLIYPGHGNHFKLSEALVNNNSFLNFINE
jgi:glyoxylase-like metal-dependent hydrolase (beta-lactamase superfamily II)